MNSHHFGMQVLPQSFSDLPLQSQIIFLKTLLQLSLFFLPLSFSDRILCYAQHITADFSRSCIQLPCLLNQQVQKNLTHIWKLALLWAGGPWSPAAHPPAGFLIRCSQECDHDDEKQKLSGLLWPRLWKSHVFTPSVLYQLNQISNANPVSRYREIDFQISGSVKPYNKVECTPGWGDLWPLKNSSHMTRETEAIRLY